MATILGLLECQRSHLTTLAEIIEKDRLWGSEQGSREILHGQRLRLFRNQKTHAELAKVLERNEADGLAMSRELQGKAAELAEQREEVLARISQPHRERYEAAVRWGHRPFLAAVQDGGCPGCGKPLPEADRRLVQESLCVVACAGCLRLLYDRGWVERGFIPSTLRPVPKPRP
jgi:predicted  nucleic acid-binding Zn-ribbon protein